VNGTSGPRDGEITRDTERGERSRTGWTDADARRNPTPPSDQNSPPDQDPAQGRARDPELGDPDAGARSIGADSSSS
jgi:hypothetical protein